jgi:hypothetical protein
MTALWTAVWTALWTTMCRSQATRGRPISFPGR